MFRMIYALTKQDTPHAERLAIAQSIRDRDSNVIHQHVANGIIVHIMDVQDGPDPFCIFCCNPVFAARQRDQDQHSWFFKHRQCRTDERIICLGHVRNPPIPFALNMDLVNPRSHGCYIRRGFETDENGGLTERHRTRCKTINNRRNTYCHLAGRPENQCVSTCP